MGRLLCSAMLFVVPALVSGAICGNWNETQCDTMNDGGCLCSWDSELESCTQTDSCEGVGITQVGTTENNDGDENDADENGTTTISNSGSAVAGATLPMLSGPVTLTGCFWFVLV
uniref:Uncharacterized protein n=1 Tax=Noctiluca scintillans TaxID=2966 RepID=A0A7S1FDZ2_NOCSC|mmetsp:Transcript_56487/g.151091  ORF Transcript_56487/g.151091 Transcript_56487/m.151091 type:complete len:115 (+) Transcript_56487:57-401(+)|eukprot:CAMPEP_0194499748 /NCGR_PEP_ID=MMETSP0253-20130528/15953_1 /TAXON_ID=2966 /ORGANISM="Noctiluca scintillans" /LENGTH=114 /DNA_ID=CAMNT_0039341525 /DNA_START=57 /DNA_END=401 /DNA_ORIENTATION=-